MFGRFGKFGRFGGAGRVLKGVKGIDFIYMDNGDVVRHQLVTKIIQRYEQWEEAKSKEVDAGEDK